jgi:hypothetical protein
VVEKDTSTPLQERSTEAGTLKTRCTVSKKKVTSWMGRFAGSVELDEAFEVDATAVVPETVAVAADRTGSSDSLGWSTLPVVNLFGTAAGVDSPDKRDSGVIGSESELDPMERVRQEHPFSQKKAHLGNQRN